MEPVAQPETISDFTCAGVILAAGFSRRFGAPKVLQKFRAQPFLQIIAGNLYRAGCRPVILVLGHQADDLRRRLPPAKVDQIVVNRDYRAGMFSSVKAGTAAVPATASGILLCLIDQPQVKYSTYKQLFDRAAAAREAIILPVHQERAGHPIYMPAWLFAEISSASSEITLRDILGGHSAQILRLPVDDAGILRDIDTPADLRDLEQEDS